MHFTLGNQLYCSKKIVSPFLLFAITVTAVKVQDERRYKYCGISTTRFSDKHTTRDLAEDDRLEESNERIKKWWDRMSSRESD
ncbi:hypothetical protein C8F04DRAFT_1071597, partial [Mycena alexandri]